MITLNRFLGYAAIVAVFLNLTNLYTFIAGAIGVNFQLIGMGLICVLFSYILINFRDAQFFLRQHAVVFFLAVYFFYPLFSMVYAPFFLLRYAGYFLTFLGIMAVTMIWVKRNGWEQFSKIVFWSWVVGIVGVGLSYFMPSLFESAAALQADAEGGLGIWANVRVAQESNARAFGFYMQSNRACLALVLHLVMLLPLWLHNKPYWRLSLIVITFGAVMFTGSRMGFLVMIGLSGLLFLQELIYGVKSKRVISSGFLMIPKYGLIVILAMLILLVAPRFMTTDGEGLNAVQRVVGSLFSSGASISEDSSVEVRLFAQRVFIDEIIRNPLFGYGCASSDINVRLGQLPLSAHNNILDAAYQYGVPIMLCMYGFLCYLAVCRNSRILAQYFRYNYGLILCVVIFVYSFGSNTVFDFRVFPVVIGFSLVMIFSPKLGSRR